MTAPKLLILGTDAAGKNYSGQLIFKRLREAGVHCAFRERRLSAKDNGGVEKDKSALGHLAEHVFVQSYPILKPLMPLLVNALLRLDLISSQTSDGAQVIVSHTALRLAAFDLGHKCKDPAEAVIPSATISLLQQLKDKHNGDTIVLDISHQTRLKRVNARGESSDAFDRYLAAQPELSERIEACMVHLALEFLDATLIENDDLSEEDLLTAVAEASPQFAQLHQ